MMENHNIIDKYKKGNKLNLKINEFNILPYNTRTYRISYRNGFSGVIGEISRMVEGYSYQEVDVYTRVDKLLEEQKIQIDSNYLDEFKRMLNSFKPTKLSYVFDNIKMLKYIPLSGSTEITGATKAENKHNNEMTKEKDFANFIYTILFERNKKLVELYKEDTKIDVLTRLFHEVYGLETINDVVQYRYRAINIPLKRFIIEDLEVLTRNEKIFLEYFENITSLYLFVYSLIVAFHIDINNESNDSKLYWFYEDEKASKTRIAAVRNWKLIKDGIINRGYINILALDMINNFTSESINSPKDLNECNVDTSALKEFIKELTEMLKAEIVEAKTETPKEMYEVIFKLLEQYYNQSKQSGSLSHFEGWFEDLGKKYFLKQRGQYGYTFNLTENNLLFFVTVIAKDERLKLNLFFEKLEERHIFLDINSRKAVINTLERLGLLEKKSDSGDAQYVKSLLERD